MLLMHAAVALYINVYKSDMSRRAIADHDLEDQERVHRCFSIDVILVLLLL